MRISTVPAGRIMRGEILSPGRYWTSFVLWSFIVHTLMLAVVSGAADYFIKSLPIPRPEPAPVMYVGLVFSGPMPLGNIPAARPAGLQTTDSAARPQKPPVRKHTGAAPAEPEAAQPAARRPSPAPQRQETPAPAEPVRRIVPAPRKSAPRDDTAIKVFTDKPPSNAPNAIPAEEPVLSGAAVPAEPDTALADRKYTSFFEPDEGSVTMITGSESTTVGPSELSPVSDVPKVDRPVLRPLAGPSAAPKLEQAEVTPPPVDISATGHVPPEDAAQAEDAAYTGPGYAEGVMFASMERAAPDSPSNVFGMFWDIMDKYAPMDYRPSHGDSAPLAIRHDEPDMPPPAEPAVYRPPVLALRSRSIKPVALPEPEPRKSPKIIEVAYPAGEVQEPPAISITKPATGETDRSLVSVTGQAAGEGVRSVAFSLGGSRMELLVSDGRFSTDVALVEGRNVLTAAVVDSSGRTARSRVVVNYVPARQVAKISFITPRNGGIIDALEHKELVVQGSVEGAGVGSVRVYLNRSITDVPVENGSFRLTTLLDSEENTLYAEADAGEGETSRSETVRFRALNLFPKDLTVVMETRDGAGVQMTHSWKPHPSAAKSGASGAPEFMDATSADGPVTSVEDAGSGIFTVGASYDIPAGGSAEVVFRVTLYGYDPRRKKTRTVGPLTLKGRGRLKAVRVLLPECVFWEDDYWFSGMIESSSGTTKFREPEGISWQEED